MAQTISYNLDSLGWMQFESLIQVLLKAELGCGIELWGGSADHGRDAYCSHELNFPSRHSTNPGPFVFQAKFIAQANAAGSDFEPLLANAVKKEAMLIQNRIEEGKWKPPQQYVFVTNAPLTASHHILIENTFQSVLKGCQVTSQGATDVCALLDLNISVARHFPQLLSLRNLFEILDQVVKNEIVQRTDAVLREADALSGVFVPTKAYEDAWDVLTKHSFVVLEGAPEMGKTAIAWIIAAVKLAQKWQAVDCDHPADFFAAYSDDREQVFVADDAFGTTEYDINRGSEWGRQLHKVIPKLDRHHWLIWTSRMHILQKALQEMSLQGSASKFPDHKEVLVKASKIERNERALMLYRHARAAGLDEPAKQIVRKHANEIVHNPHFTPERIRRFVKEGLPDLQIELESGTFSEEQLALAIKEAIENPTERMRKAYRQLEDSQRVVLIALLDCERSPEISEIGKAYKRFQEPRRPIREEIELLKEGFLQDSAPPPWAASSQELGVDWIHPSYRDLVIEELGRDTTASEDFLERCSWEGLKLALSIAGGDEGERRYPLMSGDKSWHILERRLTSLLERARTGYELRDILQTVRGSLKGASGQDDTRSRIAHIISVCCSTMRRVLAAEPSKFDERMFEELYELTMSISPPPALPDAYRLWRTVQSEFESMLESAKIEEQLDEPSLSKWINVIDLMLKSDRRVLLQDGYPDKYQALVEKLCEAVDAELFQALTFSTDEAASAESERLSEISMDLDRLRPLFPECEDMIAHSSRRASAKAASLREISRNDSSEEDSGWTDKRIQTQPHVLDLDRLFSDL